MSITARKITKDTVLKGVTPSSLALPVISNDVNPIIDDLTSIDTRVAVLEAGTEAFPVHITDTTQSTTTATGALIVDGGVGIIKAMTIGGQINDTLVTDSTTSTTGAIITAGGIGIAKALNVGTTITAVGKLTGSIVVKKPSGTTVAAGSLITGAMIASGYIEVTGTTNSSALDSCANITTAIGTTPAGTTFDFTINTMGGTPMTAGNVLTITAGASTTFMKQISAGDSASAFLATLTATAGVHIGLYRLTYDTATTCSIQRIG